MQGPTWDRTNVDETDAKLKEVENDTAETTVISIHWGPLNLVCS